jgi:hypothetical protein
MTQHLPSSNLSEVRCRHRSASGRQCSFSVVDPESTFCTRHQIIEPNDSEDFSNLLTKTACSFQNAQGINYSLGALYTLCAQGRISPRRASTLAYISSLLLRSLAAIDNDLYPKAGHPAFDAHGDPVSQSEADAPGEVDAAEADNIDATSKTPKPN